MHKLLNDIPGISCYEPQGAFYCFPSFKGVLGRTIRGRTTESAHELAEVILEERPVSMLKALFANFLGKLGASRMAGLGREGCCGASKEVAAWCL